MDPNSPGVALCVDGVVVVAASGLGPRQRARPLVQGRLVLLDREHEVGLFVGDEEGRVGGPPW